MWKVGERKEEVPAPITLPPVDEQLQVELCQRYEEATDAETRTITSAWEAELLRVIELDPHEVGQETANWTTKLLADYLGQQTGVTVTHETVRVCLHAHGYVCKRPTWTLRRKTEE
jgi:transposase